MFYTDRSVIRRTAKSHLSTPYLISLLHPFVSLYLKLCYDVIFVTLVSLLPLYIAFMISLLGLFIYLFILYVLPLHVSLYHLSVSLVLPLCLGFQFMAAYVSCVFTLVCIKNRERHTMTPNPFVCMCLHISFIGLFVIYFQECVITMSARKACKLTCILM